MLPTVRILAVLNATLILVAQEPLGPSNKEALKIRLTTDAQRLQVPLTTDAERNQYESIRDEATAAILSGIDDYVLTNVDLDRIRADDLGGDLKELLADHDQMAEDVGPPFVWIGESKSGKAAVIGFLLFRGGADGDPVHTLAGYRNAGGRLQRVASAGTEMKDFTFFVREVPSPVPGEVYLLVWGKRLLFNGTLIRFRLYSFDGDNFQVLWEPEEMLDATVSFGQNGFAIEHTNPERRLRINPNAPWKIRDEYITLPTGVQKIGSIYR